MLKNILKITFRNFRNQKIYSLINVLGFTIGLTSCLFILLYILHEKSYDRFFSKADRIYRVCFEITFAPFESRNAVSPAPAAKAFKDEFPEVTEATRISKRRFREPKAKCPFPRSTSPE